MADAIPETAGAAPEVDEAPSTSGSETSRPTVILVIGALPPVKALFANVWFTLKYLSKKDIN